MFASNVWNNYEQDYNASSVRSNINIMTKEAIALHQLNCMRQSLLSAVHTSLVHIVQ